MVPKQKNDEHHKIVPGDLLLLMIGLGVIVFFVFTTRSIRSLDGDKCPQTYALFVDVARAIHNKELSLWMPYLWGGVPNIGNFITEAFYPVNWLLCNLFYDAGTDVVSYAIIPWNLAIHGSIYFIGLYCLIKKLGFSRINAFSTSMASVLCCSFFYYRVWVVYLDGFCYLPLIILCAIMMYERKNKLPYSFLLAILFAVEASISMSLMLVISVYIFGMIFISYLFHNNRGNILHNLCYSILTGVLALLMAAPLLCGTLVFIQNMVRYVPDLGFIDWGVKLPIAEYTKYRYRWPDFLNLIKFTNSDVGISISAFVLLFCIMGLFCRKKMHPRLYYVCLAGVLICGLASFGIIFPAAFYYIPGLNQLREAYMYGILLNLFASITAAWGFHTLEQIAVKGEISKEQLLLLIPSGILWLCLFFYNAFTRNITCILFIILACLLVMTLLIRFSKLREILFAISTFLLIGLCGKNLFETINVYMYTESEAIEQVKTVCENNRRLIDYIDSLDPTDEYYRLTGWGTLPILPANMSAILGYHHIVSYLNPTFSSGIELHQKLSSRQKSQLQNVKYFLVNAEDTGQVESFGNDIDFEKVGEFDHVFTDYSTGSEATIYVYRSRSDLGDAWLVYDYSWNESDQKETIVDQIATDAIDIRRTAVIDIGTLTEAEYQDLDNMSEQAETKSVDVNVVSNNRISYEIHTDSSGILVTAELYYPGWQVHVNGEKRSLLNVDGVNRGVVVPAGDSTVEFTFKPVWFQIDVILQIIAVVIMIAASVIFLSKRAGEKYEKAEVLS